MNSNQPKSRKAPLAALLLPMVVATAMAKDAVAADSTATAAAKGTTQADVSHLTSAQAGSQLLARYEGFVGSSADTRSLIQGLRFGESVSLSDSAGGTVTFLPSTRAMGWGNVDHALSLARADLLAQGITQPTADQIRAALNGGTVTTAGGESVTMRGVLALRSEGKGWGEVARALNLPPSAIAGAGSGAKIGAGTAIAANAAGGSHGVIIRADGSIAAQVPAAATASAPGMENSARTTVIPHADVSLPSAAHGSATAAAALTTGSMMATQRGMSGADIAGSARGGLAGGVGLGIGRR